MYKETSPPAQILYDAAEPDPWRSGTERRDPLAGAPGWFAPILDELDYGMILLDGRQRVVFANRVASVQLRAMRLLMVEHHELVAVHPRDMLALSAAIRAAATQRLRRMVMIGGRDDRIAVAVVPLPHHAGSHGHGHSHGTGETRVLVMLSRRHLCEALSVYGFAREHGLSAAEGQVLQSLCEGLQPAEIAAAQGVAISTVRTQISNIRLKTEAASIRELVQRVARLPPIRSALRHEVFAEEVAP